MYILLLQQNAFLLQLVLSVATADMAAQNSNSTLLLPSTTHVINFADSHDRATFTAMSQMKEEPMDVDGYDVSNLDVNFFSVRSLSSDLLLMLTLMLQDLLQTSSVIRPALLMAMTISKASHATNYFFCHKQFWVTPGQVRSPLLICGCD